MSQVLERDTITAGSRLLDAFRATDLKIAVPPNSRQRDLLSDILALAGLWYGGLPPKPDSRAYFRVLNNGEVGLSYPRNGDVPDSLVRGLGCITVIGADVMAESDTSSGLVPVAAFDAPENTVRLVLAAPIGSDIEEPEEVKELTTSYPRMTVQYFESRGLAVPNIWKVRGATEQYGAVGQGVVADITESGETLRVNGLEEIADMGSISPYLVVCSDFARISPEGAGMLAEAAKSMGATILGR